MSRLILISLLGVFFGSLAAAQNVLNVTITVRDGVTLDATITLPPDSTPAGGFPAVVLIHGSGGSKSDMVPYATVLAANGYATLAYSVRGQGNSGGYSTSSGETERLDLGEVIQYFRRQANINPDKIGVAGGSQGGIHSWMAAVYRMPGVRAVIPTYATPHFAMDLVPNSCVKQALVWQLTLGSIRYGPDRDIMKSYIINDEFDSVLTFINARDLERLTDSVQIPVMQGLGWKDALFPSNAAIRAAANLSHRHIPVWSYFGTNGHQEQIYLPEFLYLLTISIAWFDRWLKDKPLDQSDLPMAFYSDDRPGWPHHATPVWPPVPPGTIRFYLSDAQLKTSPPAAMETFPFAVEYDAAYTATDGWNDRYGGVRFRNAFRSTPTRFLSSPFVDTADVTGIPRIHLVAASDAPRFQMHARFYDVYRADTGTVWQFMTRGTMGIRGATGPTPRDADYEGYALSHRIPPGHMIGLEITSLDMQDTTGAYILPYFITSHSQLSVSSSNPSYIDIPLVGNARVTDVHEAAATIPGDFVLRQNFPNPFNPSTTIRFQLRARLPMTLEVFDLIGRRVAVLVDGTLDPGDYSVRWSGEGYASGMYTCRLKTATQIETRKMLLIR